MEKFKHSEQETLNNTDNYLKIAIFDSNTGEASLGVAAHLRIKDSQKWAVLNAVMSTLEVSISDIIVAVEFYEVSGRKGYILQ